MVLRTPDSTTTTQIQAQGAGFGRGGSRQVALARFSGHTDTLELRRGQSVKFGISQPPSNPKGKKAETPNQDPMWKRIAWSPIWAIGKVLQGLWWLVSFQWLRGGDDKTNNTDKTAKTPTEQQPEAKAPAPTVEPVATNNDSDAAAPVISEEPVAEAPPEINSPTVDPTEVEEEVPALEPATSQDLQTEEPEEFQIVTGTPELIEAAATAPTITPRERLVGLHEKAREQVKNNSDEGYRNHILGIITKREDILDNWSTDRLDDMRAELAHVDDILDGDKYQDERILGDVSNLHPNEDPEDVYGRALNRKIRQLEGEVAQKEREPFVNSLFENKEATQPEA